MLNSKFLRIVLVISLILFSLGWLILLLYRDANRELTGPPDFYVNICDDAFQRIEPVIRGINRYHARNRHYPPDLKALVPEYIKEIPAMPPHIYSFENGAIEYRLLNEKRCQPFELKMWLQRAALSSDVDLYYRIDKKLLPTEPSIWYYYKRKFELNRHWYYCY